MGIMSRKQGSQYVISSDRTSGDAPSNRAPKGRPAENYEVWTGDQWSAEMNNAKMFPTQDDADDYVRANFAKVTGLLSPAAKPSVRRPKPAAAPRPDDQSANVSSTDHGDATPPG